MLPNGDDATLLSYECRTLTTDAESRRKFLRYWELMRPFIAYIFQATVRTIRDNAERAEIPCATRCRAGRRRSSPS